MNKKLRRNIRNLQENIITVYVIYYEIAVA